MYFVFFTNNCIADGGEYITGGDITKAGGDVVDYLSGLRGSCGPPARVQGSLIFKNGAPLTDTERRSVKLITLGIGIMLNVFQPLVSYISKYDMCVTISTHQGKEQMSL